MSFENWWAKSDQGEHAMACARFGDCIFDEVQKGAGELNARWKTDTRKWNVLIDKVVKGGFLGLGSPLMDRNWLSHVIFNQREWPSGLSKEEKQLLKLASAISGYHPAKQYGYAPGEKKPEAAASNESLTLEVLRKFVKKFRETIVESMLRSYEQVSDKYAKIIQPLCEQEYSEPCDLAESSGMFQGDMQRAYKIKSLDVDPPTYRVLLPFWDWMSG